MLRNDRLVLEALRRGVAGDDHDEFVPELLRLFQEVHVSRMEEVEDPGGHYSDHAGHA